MREPIAPSPGRLLRSSSPPIGVSRTSADSAASIPLARSRLQRALAPLDPDRLRIHERMRSEVRQLPAIAAVLDTADGNSRVRRCDAIDEHTTRIQVAGNLASPVDILGPQIAAQAELACVRRLDCCVNAWDPRHRRDGAERLFIESGHACGNSAQHGRRVKGALALYWSAAAQ